MKSLKLRWGAFVNVFLDPWVICLLAATIGFGYCSSVQVDGKIKLMFSVIMSLATGILGGVVTKHWMDFSETGILIARGKTAIRSLKVLLNSVTATCNRVCEYKKEIGSSSINKDLMMAHYDEIITHCTRLQEEAINSIENWTDIIPEADVTTKIGEITDLKLQVADKEALLRGAEAEMEKLKSSSVDEKNRFKNEIDSIKGELSQVKAKLTQQRLEIEKSVLGGIGISGGATTGLTFSQLANIGRDNFMKSAFESTHEICERCRKPIPKTMSELLKVGAEFCACK